VEPVVEMTLERVDRPVAAFKLVAVRDRRRAVSRLEPQTHPSLRLTFRHALLVVSWCPIEELLQAGAKTVFAVC
jgi:hypothetical protein